MKTLKNSIIFIILSTALLVLSSCNVSLPTLSRMNQSNEISINNISQIEALKREDYNLLRTTKGSASTSRYYILFSPIGKYKTNNELYENAYYDAVENLPNVDAPILPKQQIKKFTIPLILFNYSQRKIIVSGVGISIKGKVMENIDSQLPFTIAQNYTNKKNFCFKQPSNPKIHPKVNLKKYLKNLQLLIKIIHKQTLIF